MDTEYSNITPSSKEKCRYCASYLASGAKICTVCNRHKNWFFNHFRVDHFGVLTTLIMMIFAYFNLRLSEQSLVVTTQKHAEATQTLEKIHEAEKAIKKLQDTSTQTLDKLGFYLLMVRAVNDDRIAYDCLAEISNNLSTFKEHAGSTVVRINLELSTRVREHLAVPWSKYDMDPEQADIQEFETKYNKIFGFYKPHYLAKLWSQERFSKKEKLQFLYNIIKVERSLFGLHTACDLMEREAGLHTDMSHSKEYLSW
jgi:hypothetical protein